MRVMRLSFLIAFSLSACAASKPATPVTTAARTAHETLPFIHDDYARALAGAKTQKKPLFVDAWAPWCHSCQSLRTYVLTDPALAPMTNDFVWLSVDVEKDVNTGFVEKFPHSAVPTLWVIDPSTERAAMKWEGSVTAPELVSLLEVAVDSKKLAATEAFVRGNHALAEGDTARAETEYRAAIAAAPKGHPQRGRSVEALVRVLAKRAGACTDVAIAEAEDLPATTSRATTVAVGLSCARTAKRDAEADRLAALALHDARGSFLLPDDRSALFEELVATKKARGDAAGARALATEWASILDAEAARARNADTRTSLDPLRLSAYFALGEPARALPMLHASEHDFPQDYNPPARLARVHLELGQLDQADAAADRALARVYGPRAMRVYGLKADVANARGDRAAEMAALESALARSKTAVLTEGQQPIREALAKRLAAVREAAAK
jgi:thioredoxin-like negative regulator of GroEL